MTRVSLFSVADDSDLARLARDGRERIERETQAQQKRAQRYADTNTRVALGVHYGSPLKRIVGGIAVLGGVGVLAQQGGLLGAVPIALPLAMLFNGALAAALLQPVASAGCIAREYEFVEKRPFPVNGYFDALAIAPVQEAQVLMHVRFRTQAPSPSLLKDIVGRVDVEATVTQSRDGLTIQSSPISGATGIRSGGALIYRNHRIVPWLHELLDEVLTPVHASYPIESVDIDRLV